MKICIARSLKVHVGLSCPSRMSGTCSRPIASSWCCTSAESQFFLMSLGRTCSRKAMISDSFLAEVWETLSLVRLLTTSTRVNLEPSKPPSTHCARYRANRAFQPFRQIVVCSSTSMSTWTPSAGEPRYWKATSRGSSSSSVFWSHSLSTRSSHSSHTSGLFRAFSSRRIFMMPFTKMEANFSMRVGPSGLSFSLARIQLTASSSYSSASRWNWIMGRLSSAFCACDVRVSAMMCASWMRSSWKSLIFWDVLAVLGHFSRIAKSWAVSQSGGAYCLRRRITTV
mmetsp:Transcript_87157/g.269847  ORF Transcript_87157/g.269847 Transcript_87157/m.269847 type:complete len:283 (-) Transcript_87157:313-1161(-)